MSTRHLQAPMANALVEPGMILTLEAINPTTGAAVSGVITSAWTVYGEIDDDDGAAEASLSVGPYMLVPGPDSTGG